MLLKLYAAQNVCYSKYMLQKCILHKSSYIYCGSKVKYRLLLVTSITLPLQKFNILLANPKKLANFKNVEVNKIPAKQFQFLTADALSATNRKCSPFIWTSAMVSATVSRPFFPFL